MRATIFIAGSGMQSDFLECHPIPLCGVREREGKRETESETVKNWLTAKYDPGESKEQL